MIGLIDCYYGSNHDETAPNGNARNTLASLSSSLTAICSVVFGKPYDRMSSKEIILLKKRLKQQKIELKRKKQRKRLRVWVRILPHEVELSK